MSKHYLKEYRRNICLVKELLQDSDNEPEPENVEEAVTEQLVDSSDCEQSDSYSTEAADNDAYCYESSIDYESSDSDVVVELSFDEPEEQHSALTNDIGAWAVRNRCSRSCINELLKILKNNGHDELPKDARTLFKTPRNVSTSVKCGGSYSYLGIANGITRALLENPNFTFHGDIIEINVNIDGVPLYKSSSTQLWPILCMIQGFSSPFIVAIFCGTSKPNQVTEYLHDFILEYKALKQEGYMHEMKNYSVIIRAIICDAPARQFLKCVKAHNAYFGCERCTVEGSWEGRVVFHELDSPRRTDEDFNRTVYAKHQLRKTVLIDAGINCIKDFPLDYMHLVCLGVVKRMISFWMKGPRISKLSALQTCQISSKLQGYAGFMPSEFARQPRGLKEWKRWKATELRQFLLYTGPVVLRNILSDQSYVHFLSLTMAIRIILDSNSAVRNQYLPYAKQLLQFFVSNCVGLYGPTFTTYNTHNLIHLHDDSAYFNVPLDDISCFPFENYLQVLKKFVRKTQNPVSQVLKRVAELENNSSYYSTKCTRTHASSVKKKDSWFLLKSGEYACINEKINNGFLCSVFSQIRVENFFKEPCDSMLFNIGVIRNSNGHSRQRELKQEQFLRKVVCLTRNQGFVLIPLISDVIWK